MAAAVWGRFALELPAVYYHWGDQHPETAWIFYLKGIDSLVWSTTAVGLITAAVLTIASLLGVFFRKTFTLWIYRKACLFSHVTAWVYAAAAMKASGILMADQINIDGQEPDPVTIFMWRWQLLWPAIAACLAMAYLYILAWRRVAIRQWTGAEETEPAMGDRFLENLRTHGRDPGFRKSAWSSVSSHVFVILILPWLLTLGGCVTPYRVPKGRGTPETAGLPKIIVTVKKKPGKKKPVKRVIVSKNSAVSFHVPTLDESPTAGEVEQETRLTYSADPMRVLTYTADPAGIIGTKGGRGGKGGTARGLGSGKMGVGGVGPGGWPDGMENSLVRFIRMKYDGSGWDDGMDAVSRADINFLDFFREITGFKTASQSEAHGMALLSKYPKGYAPPFVYMTGDGDIRVSDREVRIMREYLMGGGMLFADCGSPGWHRSFQSFIKRVFPGESLVKISDDDVLFQLPFPFPNGAPPIWHHGGRDALGIRYKGRWAVFYHPGDINDAWKTNKGGLTPQMAQDALDMGVNIIYYSFSNYLELTRKYRR